MIDVDALKRERAKLTVRNGEIRRLKLDPKFKVITSESPKEYIRLEQEEKANQKRIREITETIRQNKT